MVNNWLSFTLPESSRHELDKNVKNVNMPFKPMAYDALHMTLIYFGKLVKKRQNYQNMKNVMKNIETGKTFEFKFKNYAYYPYTKRNHIVAIYETGTEGHKYVRTIRKALKEVGIVDPYEDFIPHVTMGKLVGKFLYNDNDLANLTPLPNFEATTAYMCGPLYNFMDTIFSL